MLQPNSTLNGAVNYLESTVQKTKADVSMAPAQVLEKMLNRGKVDVISNVARERYSKHE